MASKKSERKPTERKPPHEWKGAKIFPWNSLECPECNKKTFTMVINPTFTSTKGGINIPTIQSNRSCTTCGYYESVIV